MGVIFGKLTERYVFAVDSNHCEISYVIEGERNGEQVYKLNKKSKRTCQDRTKFPLAENDVIRQVEVTVTRSIAHND